MSNTPPDDDTPVRTSLPLLLRAQATNCRAQATTLLAQADTLEALAAEAERGSGADPVLDSEQTLARYSIGRDGLKAAAERGELTLQRGARGKIMVRESELRRWLESRPYQARPRKVEAETDLDAWEREQEAELARLGGGRRG